MTIDEAARWAASLSRELSDEDGGRARAEQALLNKHLPDKHKSGSMASWFVPPIVIPIVILALVAAVALIPMLR